MEEEKQPEFIPQKRPPTKKLRKPVGPFETQEMVYEKGKEREVIVTVLAHGIDFRLKGRQESYLLPHSVGYVRAVSIAAGLETGPLKRRR
jgi:hypothetical protein